MIVYFSDKVLSTMRELIGRGLVTMVTKTQEQVPHGALVSSFRVALGTGSTVATPSKELTKLFVRHENKIRISFCRAEPNSTRNYGPTFILLVCSSERWLRKAVSSDSSFINIYERAPGIEPGSPE